MLLSLKTVASYLLACGLIDAETIVDGGLTIEEASRRNLNFKVRRRQGPGYFVKQIQVWNAQTIAELQREAACYLLPLQDAAFSSLASLAPRHVLYDPARNILITELLSQGENVSEHHRRAGKFPVELGAALGRMLAAYHGLVNGESNNPRLASFPRAVPWILSLHLQQPSQFADISAGNAQMIHVLRQYPDFYGALDALRGRWQKNALIHGDMKWDNCLVETAASPDATFQLRLVDWELADIGDAAWDAGAIFQAYLSFWILSINMPAGASPAQWLLWSPYKVEAMQPAMRGFWQAYCRSRGLAGSSAETWLERSLQYAAARMIQTVYECSQQAPQLNPNTLCLLQVSMNILLRTHEAIHELLGL